MHPQTYKMPSTGLTDATRGVRRFQVKLGHPGPHVSVYCYWSI